jgi:predicted nucleic acid-binding protein
VSETWIVNASPLILLAKVGQLDLLARMANILVPAAVRAEILAGPVDDPARQAIEAGWGGEVTVSSTPGEVLEWGLGAGETEVLAAALEHRGARVMLDDAQARACASTLGLPVIGTIGAVLRAKALGLLSAAGPVAAELESAGLRIDAATVREALKSVGEG